MKDERPHPWLGCPVPVKLFFGDCGHLMGCSDPMFDLQAERASLRKLDFERCMTMAIGTGGHGRRSSCQQRYFVCEAIDAVASDTCPQTIWRAQRAFDDQEGRYAKPDE